MTENATSKPQVAENVKIPAANKPGVEQNEEGIEITSDPYDAPVVDTDEMLTRWGFSPDEYEVVNGSLKVSEWEVLADGETRKLWSYKAGVRKRDTPKSLNYDDLVREVKAHRKKPKEIATGEATFVICVADTQFGKADGDGLKGTIQRFLTSTDNAIDRFKDLKKIGRPLDKIVVAGIGDIVEGCDGQYASQAYNVEINRREQTTLARRLNRDLIIKCADVANQVDVTAVPGNHGENRRDGREYTTPGDNDDVAIFEQIQDILSANPKAYGHVRFHLPENEIYTVLDISGTKVGFTHGHIAGSGNMPQKKILDWWVGQSFGGQEIADAKILVTGHYHHFSVIEHNTSKIHIQCPSVESESTWWKNLKGQVSPPGLLTFVVDSNGYKDLQVV